MNSTIQTKSIPYTLDGITMQGEMTLAGHRPAVLVMHEWWGAMRLAMIERGL